MRSASVVRVITRGIAALAACFFAGCASPKSQDDAEAERILERIYQRHEVECSLDLDGWRLTTQISYDSQQHESGHLWAWRDGKLLHVESCSALAGLLSSFDPSDDPYEFYRLVDAFLLDEGIPAEQWKPQRRPGCCDPGISRIDLEVRPMTELAGEEGSVAFIDRRAARDLQVALVRITLGPKRYEVAPR